MSIITCGQIGLKNLIKIKNKINEEFGDLYNENQIKELACKQYWKKFDEECEMGFLMQEKAHEVKERLLKEGKLPSLIKATKTPKTFFISIRPDETKTSFEKFHNDISTMLKRDCFEHFTLVFEQKSTNVENLGKGFHCHILTKMTQKGKAEVLRDLFGITQGVYTKKVEINIQSYTAPNCIRIDLCKTQKDIDKVKGYIIDHLAKDGHKKITEETDRLWREKLNLQANYIDPPDHIKLPTLSSTLCGQEKEDKPIILNF